MSALSNIPASDLYHFLTTSLFTGEESRLVNLKRVAKGIKALNEAKPQPTITTREQLVNFFSHFERVKFLDNVLTIRETYEASEQAHLNAYNISHSDDKTVLPQFDYTITLIADSGMLIGHFKHKVLVIFEELISANLLEKDQLEGLCVEIWNRRTYR